MIELKGIKEYLPEEQEVREYITDILKTNFKKYGFKPLETSILEDFSIAASKYAGREEILKETYQLTDQGQRKLCLRYELTFKLGKLIALNPTLRLPLKRYEIGKVFRDGPVKTGRLREFTQCDVDVVGIKNLAIDAEFIAMSFDIFNNLNLPINIQINNRKLLFGIFKECNISEKQFINTALSLDKLEKIGEKEVTKELKEFLNEESIDSLFELLNACNSLNTNTEKLNFLKSKCQNELFLEGYNELNEIFSYTKSLDIKEKFYFIPTLSRGLGYYTGTMWEVYLQNSKVKSSVAAGGRWDSMISKFLESDREYPASGMTFGLDVIYTALKEDNILLTEFERTPKILIIPLDKINPCLELVTELRKNKISTNIAYDDKLSKALDYANKESIPYILVIGKKEIESKIYGLKNMISGETKNLKINEIIKELNQ
jgi:histidyl-tRNA synthetase